MSSPWIINSIRSKFLTDDKIKFPCVGKTSQWKKKISNGGTEEKRNFLPSTCRFKSWRINYHFSLTFLGLEGWVFVCGGKGWGGGAVEVPPPPPPSKNRKGESKLGNLPPHPSRPSPTHLLGKEKFSTFELKKRWASLRPGNQLLPSPRPPNSSRKLESSIRAAERNNPLDLSTLESRSEECETFQE